MEYMKTLPDNAFDLAVVDPPYGGGFTEGGGCRSTNVHYTNGMRKCQKNYQKIRLDKNRKKSLRGMFPQRKNTLKNSFASHAIRLFGAGITLNFHLHAVFSYGAS